MCGVLVRVLVWPGVVVCEAVEWIRRKLYV